MGGTQSAAGEGASIPHCASPSGAEMTSQIDPASIPKKRRAQSRCTVFSPIRGTPTNPRRRIRGLRDHVGLLREASLLPVGTTPSPSVLVERSKSHHGKVYTVEVYRLGCAVEDLLVSRSLRILNPPAPGECPLLEGNQEAWITCCSERFFPLAKRIAGGDSLAEDTLQASWIKIMQAVNHACFNGPKACSWVGKIVANAAKDVRRRRVRHEEIPLSEVEDPGRSPEALAQEKQLLTLLREIISLLPETYRQVVDLRLHQGLSTGQTAHRLHISSSLVKTRLKRAVRMIQRRIDARIQIAAG